jgi:hypothetical protein
MADMTEKEATAVITEMLQTAVRDRENLKLRIRQLELDYEADPWEGTAAQIPRLEARLSRKIKEADALAIAVLKL